VLLKPLIARLKKQGARVVCIDIDSRAISQAERLLDPLLGPRVRYINTDFLSWSEGRRAVFDCVVMNPPFAGGKQHLRRLKLSGALGRVAGSHKFMPLEAAFLCRAIELLSKGGRLLAVLPTSIVMSESTQWLRNLLVKVGSIRMVHELPPKSFPAVESRMYLFVFEKGVRQSQITFLNHDLEDPEQIYVTPKNEMINRLDFGYQRAQERLESLTCQSRFGWKTVDEVACVLRGGVKSPIHRTEAVHTTDFHGGFWRRQIRSLRPPSKAGPLIRRGDLLIQRVGRNCHKTLGRPTSLKGLACSDCVLIVRPNDVRQSTRFLFSLRTLLHTEWTRPLLEKGTGASYVSHKSLLGLPIPMKLNECFPKIYALFVDAQRAQSPAGMLHAVQLASMRLSCGAE
jgi:tRNA1(Val) A37 N6-methylase TrmN6